MPLQNAIFVFVLFVIAIMALGARRSNKSDGVRLALLVIAAALFVAGVIAILSGSSAISPHVVQSLNGPKPTISN